MPLPVNVDGTYPDDPTRPDKKLHQQHHDVIHAFVNEWEDIAPADGQIPVWDAATSTWVAGSGGGGGGGGDHPDSDHETLTTVIAGLATEITRATTQENLKLAKASNLSDLANAATARTNLGLGTAATQASSAFEVAGAAAAAQAAAIAASQPLDSDLTAIAALSTTSFGRSLLTLADAATGRTALGLGTAATQNTGAFDAAGAAAAAQAASQPLDSDLTALAALSTTAYGRSLLEAANAAALRILAGLVIGTDVQGIDAELTAIAGLTSAADRLPYFTGSGAASLATFTAAGRALVDDADAAAQLVTLGAAPLASPTFTGTPTVPDDAYDATSWNGSTGIPTKNALRDKIETLGGGAAADGPLPFTFHPQDQGSNTYIATANRCAFLRAFGSGTITKIAIRVVTSGGNIEVGIARNAAAGPGAPTTRIATSGSIACPSPGYAEIALGGSVTVDPTRDYFFLGVDSASAAYFVGAGSAGVSNDGWWNGLAYYQDSAFPCPASPAPSLYSVAVPIMAGRP